MKRVAGIWDLARSSGSLGTLLILLEELEIQRQIHGADLVDVVIVGNATHLVNGMPSRQTDVPGGFCISDVAKLAPMIAVLRAMSGVSDCHVCADQTKIRDVTRRMRTNCVMWPDPEMLMQGRHSYDSTHAIQDFYAREGNIPRLSVDAPLLVWAKSYLKEKARGRLPVAVHLKNDPNVSGESNANIDSWWSFMSNCRHEYEVHFILVGDDRTNGKFRTLKNVTIAQDDGVTLERYLAIIQSTGLFMGTMSGPANMALFGKNPYLIFKHPDHHAREMAMELGDSDHYPFALAHQRVLRMWDTTERLFDGFESVYRQVFA